MSKLSFDDLKNILSCGSTLDNCMYCDEEDIIIRGSVKQQTFNLPFNYNIAKKLAIFYIQDKKIVFKKTGNDVKVSSFDPSLIYFNLTEYETFILSPKYPVDIQMKVLLEDGSILISEAFKIKVSDTLDGSLFNDNILQYVAITANVNNQEIKVVKNQNIYSNSESVYLCKFNYDSSWDNFSKTVYFKNDLGYKSNPINGDLGDIYVIPKEAITRPGNLYIGVVGWTESIKKPTSWSSNIKIDKSCDEFIESSGSGSSGGAVPYASETIAGIMKLYKEPGAADDGTINQDKITKGFRSIKFGVSEEVEEGLVLDVDF